MKNPGLASAVSIAAFGMAGAVAAGPSLALAKPPLQLSGPGVRVEPLAIATARIENGKFVFGEWQEYQVPLARGEKRYFYAFDCLGGYLDGDSSPNHYVNLAHEGTGVAAGELRWPSDRICGLGSSRWYFGSSYVNPLMVEDIESLAHNSQGGFPIDAIDVAWYWGGGECVVAFFTSEESGLCEFGDPMDHAYHTGVAINLGTFEPGGYYLASIDGIWSANGLYLQMPGPDSSYLAALLNPDGYANTLPGTQLMLWGTGESSYAPFQAGIQETFAWDDDAPINGLFGENECYVYDYGVCPGVLGKTVGFLALRCPADLNWDGFVNADDFDLFAGWFEAPDWHRYADLTGDGFVNADDFDRFALWFDEGC